ncbi:hypothetical protein CDD83_9830 [Cordyceps sp. RAO-2017]|nr:hypothetical protein CDD83_9830 [Cordyceps sp. RAO-2017]
MARPGPLRLLVAAGVVAARLGAALHAGCSSWGSIHSGPGPQQAGLASGSEAEPARFKAYNLSVPVDHFHNESKYEPHSNRSFNLRYWLDTSHYRDGGPVLVLHSGEAPSDERLPYLEYGILAKLAKRTHGVALILEHRYYGTSFPVPNTTTENLRFLSTEQTLADNAYFARHVRFPGLEHVNLTAGAAPWIIYGGSYAGSVAALTRKLYPDAYWGAISSSGVLTAIDDFWQYFEAARHFAPGRCSPVTQKLTHVVDSMLLSGDKAKARAIKGLFGLADLLDDEFGTTIAGGILGMQSREWDPAEDSASLGSYCAVITADVPLFASTAHLRPVVGQAVSLAGYDDELETLAAQMLNYVGYVRDSIRRTRTRSCKGQTLRECLSMRFYESQTGQNPGMFRTWTYQTCTQWGFFFTGAGTPKDQLSMVSRAITLEYASILCPLHFNITTRPDVESINKLGGFDIRYPRIAFVDGAQDPWRQAGPHAIGQPDRASTASEPFILIDPGVHHWDENGLANETEADRGLPPKQVADAQEKEVEFVKAWLQEWDEETGRRHKGHAAKNVAASPEL